MWIGCRGGCRLSSRRADGNARADAGAQGFTLIEVLVALAIAALGLAMLMAAAGTGLNNAGLADQYIEATRRAQSRLALVGTAMPLVTSDLSGDDGGGFSWHVRISPPVVHDAPPPGSPPAPASYTVDVVISWLNGGRTRSVALDRKSVV